ncbi:hypothetical protein CTU88_41220 [Streptomyces sp. JV178]|jgi:hypothetical protein|uniref:hypothetical protein n=1 Tax=unclassified Streptomyces TaxID=2593676 RepID=UPI000C1B18CF|nr:hypothetical protein [Streptomyces sp. JV178]PIM66798.1 hypothetical protein CTU88_41220 [Streptomyces sp. JV178]
MRNRIAVLAVAAVLPLTAAASLATATQAGADPKSPKVTVKGSVDDCSDGTSAVKVTIKTVQESRTDKSPDVEDNGEYSIALKKVPAKGQKAKATVTCEEGATYKDTFTLKRPAGTSTTLDNIDLAPQY